MKDDRGCRYGAFLARLAGGTRGKKFRGANVLLVWCIANVSDHEVQEYVNARMKEGLLD